MILRKMSAAYPEGSPSQLKLFPSRVQLAEKLAYCNRRYESLLIKWTRGLPRRDVITSAIRLTHLHRRTGF